MPSLPDFTSNFTENMCDNGNYPLIDVVLDILSIFDDLGVKNLLFQNKIFQFECKMFKLLYVCCYATYRLHTCRYDRSYWILHTGVFSICRLLTHFVFFGKNCWFWCQNILKMFSSLSEIAIVYLPTYGSHHYMPSACRWHVSHEMIMTDTIQC